MRRSAFLVIRRPAPLSRAKHPLNQVLSSQPQARRVLQARQVLQPSSSSSSSGVSVLSYLRSSTPSTSSISDHLSAPSSQSTGAAGNSTLVIDDFLFQGCQRWERWTQFVVRKRGLASVGRRLCLPEFNHVESDCRTK